MKEEDVKVEENLSPLYGMPWKNEFTAQNFEEADAKRNNILKSAKVQVKVRRRSNGTFVVKTRDTNIAKPASKKKKSAKNKNKEQ